MVATVTCPNCTKRLGIPDNTSGSMLKCPFCQKPFVVASPAAPGSKPAVDQQAAGTHPANATGSLSVQLTPPSTLLPQPQQAPAQTTTPQGVIRPTPVLVMGILNLIVGGLFLTYVCIAGVGYTMIIDTFGSLVPAQVIVYMILAIILHLVITVGLIVSGIGLLAMQSWGRILAIMTAAVMMVVWCLQTILYYSIVVPQISLRSSPGATAVFWTVFTCMIVFGYAIALLITMFLPTVSEAFAKQAETATA